mmetsp:Transcript_15991/g.64519  ORF Transcript_15991/g.64519 Transcript_15991/m.64519 type:complete len:367 (-) Transcript_15991:721-1821(-)
MELVGSDLRRLLHRDPNYLVVRYATVRRPTRRSLVIYERQPWLVLLLLLCRCGGHRGRRCWSRCRRRHGVVIVVVVLILVRRRGLLGAVLVEVLPELVGARHVDAVDETLVQGREEDDVVAEAREAVHDGLLDDEGEEVVDEGVEGLVGHGAPREVGDRLEAVVDVELGRQRDEAEDVDERDARRDGPAVPSLVRARDERVEREADHERHGAVRQMRRRDAVVLGSRRRGVVVLDVHADDAARRVVALDPDGFREFPELGAETDGVRGEDHPRGLVVEEVQQNDELHDAVDADRARRDADEVLLVAPVLDVGAQREHLEDQVEHRDDGRHGEEPRLRVGEDFAHHVVLALLREAERLLRLPLVLER